MRDYLESTIITMNTMLTAVYASSATLVLFMAAAFLSRHLILERLRNAVAHEYALKLETHKAEVAAMNLRAIETLKTDAAHQQAVLTATVSTLSAAHIVGHQRTLDSIAILWKETRRVADWLPGYASRSDILLDTELGDDVMFQALIAQADEHEQVTSLIGQSHAEDVRPFVGEYLYAYFFAYRAFTGRIAAKLLDSHRAGRATLSHDDPYTVQLLSAVLGTETVKVLRLDLPGRIRRAQAAIESHMVEHIAKVLSGEASAAFNIHKAQEIVAIASRKDVPG